MEHLLARMHRCSKEKHREKYSWWARDCYLVWESEFFRLVIKQYGPPDTGRLVAKYPKLPWKLSSGDALTKNSRLQKASGTSILQRCCWESRMSMSNEV